MSKIFVVESNLMQVCSVIYLTYFWLLDIYVIPNFITVFGVPKTTPSFGDLLGGLMGLHI